ncbi:hypothetical protein [Agrobacterium sp.]|uniref:hypothetical protein n=1 Tax=Agrobacterium sp. TaxID=361 RepID=UPI00289AAF1D|nr:hypothetical protein [Agrobacterium sp.]
MQTKLYFRYLAFGVFICCQFFGASLVLAEQFDDLLGFELGGTLREARKHAVSKGWQLKQLSAELPDEWMVDGTNLSLFICDDKIGAIRKQSAGGLDEFVSIVSELQAKYGTPQTKIGSFMAGRARVSDIRANFSGPEALNVSVGFSSTDGHLGIHVNFLYNDSCPGLATSR